jgi:hypothetical protein
MTKKTAKPKRRSPTKKCIVCRKYKGAHDGYVLLAGKTVSVSGPSYHKDFDFGTCQKAKEGVRAALVYKDHLSQAIPALSQLTSKRTTQTTRKKAKVRKPRAAKKTTRKTTRKTAKTAHRKTGRKTSKRSAKRGTSHHHDKKVYEVRNYNGQVTYSRHSNIDDALNRRQAGQTIWLRHESPTKRIEREVTEEELFG